MAISRPEVFLASAMLLSACVARSLDDGESESTGGAAVTGDDDGAMTSGPPTTGASAPTSGAEASAGSGVPPEPMTTTTTTTTEPMTTGPVTTTEPANTTGAPDELSCESYCEIYQGACKDYSEYDDVEECLAQCSQWPVGLPNETVGDSLGCRTYHVSVATTIDPVLHCPHAGPSGAGTCVSPDAPSCASYCDTYFTACMGMLNEYAGKDDCLAQCADWYPGADSDTIGDSVACRDFHANEALKDPPTHCSHAGPSGGQVCETQQ